jgi:DNA-binding NarL/FixJ family response regulator
MKSIRILIADDHAIFREGLRRLLESEAGLKVIGEAVNGEEAVALVRRHKPDVLLLDLAMPHKSGLETLRHFPEAPQPTRVILLTALIEREQIVEALQLGARGVVLKESAVDVLISSINHVIEGKYWVGGHSVSDLVEALGDLRAVAPVPNEKPTFGLTQRELQIIRYIVAGAGNRDIAGELGISEQTVKNHLSAIFDKVGVFSRLELALLAVKSDLPLDS